MRQIVKQAVILVGGLGTRLMPLTINRPKPTMPVLDEPFVNYLIKSLSKANITDIIMACGYKPDILAKFVGNGKDMGVNITYIVEDTPLGTAGAIKNLESILDPVFVCANGDTLNFLDVSSVIETHFRLDARLTISMAQVEDPSNSGVLVVNDNGYVKHFQEKPNKEDALSNNVSTGLYVMNREILEFVPNDTFFDLQLNLFPLLLNAGVSIGSHLSNGIWIDIGRPLDLIRMNCTMAHFLYSNNSWPYQTSNSTISGQFYIGKDSTAVNSQITNGTISSKCTITDSVINNSLIMNNCRITGANIINSIIGENCIIGNDSLIENQVLKDGTIING